MNVRVGATVDWQPEWRSKRRGLTAAAIVHGADTQCPTITLNARFLGLDPRQPPTDAAQAVRCRNILIHELLHTAVGRDPGERAHGRQFVDRCRRAARAFCLPPPGPDFPAVSWPHPTSSKKRKTRHAHKRK